MTLLSSMIQIEWIYTVYAVLPILVISCIFKAVDNLFWHPLSRFPGPRLSAVSRLPYAWCHASGKLAVTFHALHKQYGPIVRTAPNELSFIEPEAIKKIYAERRKLCPVFRKNYDTFNETRNQIAHSVFIAGDDDHARMRKIINYAFCEQALRDQEPRIQTHVETLIKGLDSERSKTNGTVDLNEWYNCAAFDIIADAAFGEPFNTLQESTYRPWLSLIGKTWKAITFASAVKSMAPPLYFFHRLIPTGPYLQKEVDKFNLILDRVRKRMAVGTTRISLLSLVLEHNNEKENMTEQEVISNATLFVAAGTETVTTLLSSLTYLLTRNDRVMRNLTMEIRNSFSDESQMTVQNVSQLQYLTACIREALRVFPPIPEGLPRVVPPGGEEISGQFVPGGTFVQVSNLAACLSPANFIDPESFLPERWLGIDPRFSADKKDASQPFSVGPRNCVGQNLAMAEMRLIATRILWRFDLRCHLEDEWRDQPTYLLWEKKPLPIELISVR